jgi:two-component system NtrC family response regulator
VGDKDEQNVDVRFIFATNRDLQAEVEAGRFSEALYHRLNVFNIPLPALKERKEDIPTLVEYFLVQSATGEGRPRIAPRAMHCLLSYDWPGNVRELRNVLERGLILSDNNLIIEHTLPLELAGVLSESPSDAPFPTLQEVEREHIIKVLNFVNGRRARAAEMLGIGRKTLYRKLQALSIDL